MNSTCLPPMSPFKSLDKCDTGPTNSILDATTAMLESFGDWQIRSDIVYLDNGAFGACPTIVVEQQQHIRRWIEENPHEFFERNYIKSWESSRKVLASFLHADAADIVFTPGATHGMNVVIQSLNLDSGDEIITTNHAYSSVRLVLDHIAEKLGATVVVVDIPLEVPGPDALLQRILSSVTPRTRFAIIDHVPSRSGLIFPIKEIVSELASLNIDTLVDGAHAPGMIPLDVTDINAAYYVANCHKWMCVPRGVGFLHVRRDRVQNIKPVVIARSPFVVNKSKHSHLEHSFGWMGTYCPSALLTLPTSISYLRTVLPGGYNGLISRNHDLTVLARRIVCRTLGIPLPCPDNMIGAMATIPLPDSPGPEQEGMLPIQQILWKEHGIIIPIYSWPAYPKRVMRLSVQAYNYLDQYLRLANCLRSVLHNERLTVQKTLNTWPLKSLKQPDAWGNTKEHASTEYASACGHAAESGVNSIDCLTTPHDDIENPTVWTLVTLAQSRVRRIMHGIFNSYPVSLYPTAGENETLAGTASSSHANLELSRVTYMLSTFKRRRLPKLMAPVIARLLEAEDVVGSWADSVDVLRNQAQILTRAMVSEMDAPRTPNEYSADANKFVQKVAIYEPESHDRNLSLTFWLRALADFTVKGQWSLARITSFLQIHAFLKDPVGGLRSDFVIQRELYSLLFNKLKPDFEDIKHSQTVLQEVVAQLALESSFLSQPLIRDTAYVHFIDDQQLVYSYVDIDNLARSEFSCTDIVIGMIQDIIGNASRDECLIAPITVASSYPVCSSHNGRPVIIDGNNRTTTIAFLRFVSNYGVPKSEEMGSIQEHCRDYGLGPVCFVDFCKVLSALWQSYPNIIEQLRRPENVALFRKVRQLPALVTEESSFFTKTLLDVEESVLQPVHQSIFATDDLLVAFPGKMQSHGRARGFMAMPIR
ncbi:pyridoxal phosphate-dependent transferase [Xylaria bambusicola]|uniref:pyridoxal phosphate-dependent transferase n=1 Tax=Xylaria bambusicola TaxID=326684 RepID=UPI002007B70F|nr:pyridoxal phosphate-dependent transferase [Xylaria bambusicola]KAI0522081.1 pyridoxal phosphate-dependent transferase [Xylaria bambusicola]